MPRQLIQKLKRHRKRNTLVIYSAVLLLTFHTFLVAYVNSSYIDSFVGQTGVTSLYIIASSLTVLIFLFISRVLQGVGNYQTTLGLIMLNLLAVSSMAFVNDYRFIIPLFITHITIIPLIYFNLDVFLEENLDNQEGTTGTKRGLLLAMSSLVGALSPLLAGYLTGSDSSDFTPVYVVSALALVPMMMIIIFAFKNFRDPLYKEIKLFSAIRSFWIRPDIRHVFSAHFLLQMFFCFTVVYIPLYLATVIGLNWQAIGIILFGGQLAYVFFEYPIGEVADKYIGEKEMMLAGFIILGGSIMSVSFIETTSVWPWIIAMFATRVGASLIEVTTESYFFKHTKSSDAQIISFFRITRPLAYVVGTLVAGLVLLYLPFNYLFLVIGVLMLPGVIFAHLITDTK